MSTELTEQVSPDIINSLILTGDMSKLTAGQQTQYYNAVCKSVGINPLTQPFAIITLQGKKTLYATKGCTQQLSDSRKINTEIKKKEVVDGVYIAECRATMPDGRYTDDIGAVSIGGLKGSELANAMMKSITKAKRRAVLALCGLGIPDESEVEDMPQHPASDIKPQSGKSRVETLVENQVEEAVVNKVEDAVTKPIKEEVVKKSKKSNKPADGILYVDGIIDGQPRSGVVEGKGTKYLFKIQDKEYGTFNEEIVKKMMEVVDMQQKKPKNRFLIKIGYTQRESDKTKGKFFYDIVSCDQVTTDDIEIPIG